MKPPFCKVRVALTVFSLEVVVEAVVAEVVVVLSVIFLPTLLIGIYPSRTSSYKCHALFYKLDRHGIYSSKGYGFQAVLD